MRVETTQDVIQSTGLLLFEGSQSADLSLSTYNSLAVHLVDELSGTTGLLKPQAHLSDLMLSILNVESYQSLLKFTAQLGSREITQVIRLSSNSKDSKEFTFKFTSLSSGRTRMFIILEIIEDEVLTPEYGKELEKGATKLKAVLENSSDIITLFYKAPEPNSPIVVHDLNRAMLTLFQRIAPSARKEDFINQPAKEAFEKFNVLKPEEMEKSFQTLKDCFEIGRVTQEQNVWHLADGSIHSIVMTRHIPIVIGDHVEFVMRISSDVTALIQSNHQLEEEQRRLDLALEAASLGMYDWNMELNESRVNKTIRQILGSKADGDDPLGYFMDCVHPDDREVLIQNLNELLENPSPESTLVDEFRLILQDEVRWFKSQSIVLTNSQGTPYRLIGILYETTIEKRYAEALNQRNKELEQRETRIKEALFHNSHMIRKPVANIIGLSTILGQIDNKKEMMEVVELVQQSAREMEETILEMNNLIANISRDGGGSGER